MDISKKHGYRIFDNQLAEFKKGYPIFKTNAEAYEWYGPLLYEQCLDGNCGYDECSIEEIIVDLSGKTNKDLFEMFGYSVVKV